MNIHLHIERLVLDGLPLDAAHAPAVHTAVEAELTRLLAAGGPAPGLQRSGALAYARGADVHLSPTPAPDELGRHIGGAIHQGLAHELP